GTGMEDRVEAYFDALMYEARFYSTSDPISSVYIGGGTPSCVDESYIEKLMQCLTDNFTLEKDCEISIESNPNSLSRKKAQAYRRSGINRISMGVQSVSDELLKRIGRLHTHADTERAVEDIIAAGFDNFNLDLMFSLPGQTPDDFSRALDFAASSGAKHISCYSLTLEEDTPINQLYKDGIYREDDGLDRQMYQLANEKLFSKGFYRYEISNFARMGYECRHNLYCWDFQDYLGLGVAAHSFFGDTRFVNTASVDDYIKNIYDHSHDQVVMEETREELIGDYLMLALRKTTGINTEDFERRFGENFDEKYSDITESFIGDGLLYRNGPFVALTQKGFDFANVVMREYL
ncbi:MAG: radical SAM family heme chaperone HemW, partial [Eubacteriaceae bacterium]|nr:radical SAM family heme chaperone HemW [Eubacteriaceae bacterium]